MKRNKYRGYGKLFTPTWSFNIPSGFAFKNPETPDLRFHQKIDKV